MTQGFYRQLDVPPSANTEDVRAAYRRLVAQMVRRRKTLVEQGGDTAALDLTRAQADEAWAVLSDPARRRRYDAMLAVGEDVTGAEDLWDKASGAVVSPPLAAAADLLATTTRLQVGKLPESPGTPQRQPAPSFPAAEDPPTEPTESMAPPYSPETTDLSLSASAPLPTPTPSLAERAPPPIVVAPSLTLLSTETPRPTIGRAVSGEDMARLVDQMGYTGALLRAAREARGIELEDLSDNTRISEHYLRALENDDHGDLPSATFVRGYVREISRNLGLDAESVVAGYMARFSP
jgi:hypothetical protein